MIASMSFIDTVIERARAYVNEPDTLAKFTDDWLIRHALMPSMVDVLARLNLNCDNPIYNRFDITMEAGVKYYQLPPSVGEVHMLAIFNDAGDMIDEALPRHILNIRGSGWRLEGNLLVIDPAQTGDQTRNFSVVYVSNGDVMPHYATDGSIAVDSEGQQRFYLSQDPDKGALDRREHAYVGQMLRLIPQDGGPIEERVIGASGVETGGAYWVEPRVNFNFTAPTEKVTYEIAPAGAQSLYDAIALMTAMRMATMSKQGAEYMKRIELLYRTALKTVKDSLHYMQMRQPKHWDRATKDNKSPIYLG